MTVIKGSELIDKRGGHAHLRKYKSFRDLEFAPHPLNEKMLLAYMEFPNGNWISVVKATTSDRFGWYCSEETYEVYAPNREKKSGASVRAYQSSTQVTRLMSALQKQQKGGRHESN